MSRIAGILNGLDDRSGFQSALDLMNPEQFPTHILNLNQLQFGYVLNPERKSELDSQSILEKNEELTFSRNGCFITADVRLDNRKELSRKLEIGSTERDELFDCSLILSAYRKWGNDCLQYLEGDFAFALWDEAKKRLFCARDHLGIRPFYYHHSEQSFYFASEIKALLKLNVSNKLNEFKVAEYLLRIFENKSQTFYENIRKLEPGHFIQIQNDELKIERYFQFNKDLKNQLSNEDSVETFYHLVESAVKDRVTDSIQPGFMLSGGLDSSSIIALADQFKDLPLVTLSGTFESHPEIDEKKYIQILKDQFGFENHLIPVDHLEPLYAVDEMYQTLDEPFYSPNLFVYWELCKKAKELGLKVLIDGVDGDTTVSHGTRFLTDLFLQFKMKQFLVENRRCARRFRNNFLRFIWNYGPYQGWLLPAVARFNKIVKTFPRVPEFFNKDFANQIEREKIHQTYNDYFSPPINLSDEHLKSLQSGLLPMYLEVNDQVVNHFGMKHCHPYYSQKLMEFCLSLSGELRIQKGFDRYIQRKAFENILLKEIVHRIHKSVWTESTLSAFVSGSSERVLDLFSDSNNPLGNYIDLKNIKDLYQRNKSNPVESELIQIWTVVTFGIWLEKINQ